MKKVLALTAAMLCMMAGQSHAGWWSNYWNYAKTENPIMLVPGIFAFDTIAIVDYWYQIPNAIEYRGGEVYVAEINAFDSSVGRGEELIEQLEEIKAASNGRIKKFNLIGHSQGGMTSRYVMETRPDLVASVSTSHTPHTGTPIADLVSSVAPPSTIRGTAFGVFANAVGDIVNLLSGANRSNSDVFAMLSEFNSQGSTNFNSTYTNGLPSSSCGNGPSQVNVDGNDIKLYSWSGVGQFTNIADISDPLFGITSLAFSSGDRNDGITGECSSHFGMVIRDDYFMNHIDANNQIFGLTSLFETDPKTLFRNHANRLKNAGL